MRFTFCPDCGKKLSHRDLGDEKNVPWCDDCDRPWFDCFYCCVIAIARRDGKYALIRQISGEKGVDDNRFVCVSGYINVCESAETAAMREVNEELGLEPLGCKLISSYVYEKKKMLMLGFMVDVDEGEFCISSELKEAEWFDREQAVEKLANTAIGRQLLLDIIRLEEN